MSDNNSDYYSDSSDSDNSQTETFLAKKKPQILNPAKQYGNYIEDDSDADADIDDADNDADDADDDNEVELDGIKKDGEISDDETDDDDADADVDDDEENDDIGVGGGDDEDIEENDDDDDDIEIDEEGEPLKKNEKQTKATKPKKTAQLIIADDDDDEDEYEENYLQKFENNINKNYITDFHPECLNNNSDEVLKLSNIIRDENNIIIDPFHRTLSYLTKYEKARILGQRAKQIENGAKPFVKVPENIIDSYLIAELELREKKIPFIIKRPLPNGAFEYWNIKDLEIIQF